MSKLTRGWQVLFFMAAKFSLTFFASVATAPLFPQLTWGFASSLPTPRKFSVGAEGSVSRSL